MSVNVKVLITVIWITFLSLVHSATISLISSRMRDELKDCPFPPDDVKETVYSWCTLPIPDLLDTVKFQFSNYLCMELFDVSLQLRDQKIANTFRKTEDDKNIYLPKADTFCSQLNFSETRSKLYGAWADVAIRYLKLPEMCAQFCVADDSLNALCGHIYLANRLLMALNLEPPVTAEPQDMPANGNVSDRRSPSPDNEDGIKNQNTEDAQKSIADGSNNLKQRNDSTDNVEKGTKGHDNSKDISEQVTGSIALNVAEQRKKQSEVTEQLSKEVTLADSSDTTVSKNSSNVSSHGTDHPDRSNSNASTDEQDDKDDGSSFPRGDSDDRGNIENPTPSFTQEATYDVDDEPQNAASSNGQPSDNNKVYLDTSIDAQDSHFFAYFLTMVVICIIGYLVFHNKQKIIALALEGRRMQGSRRRPNTSSYKKLDSNLEEAVTSTCSSSSVTHVIF